jgi:adenylate cyclase class IV
MDQHSEVEAKFLATEITPEQILMYIADNSARISFEGYKDVQGWDTYWRQGDRMVRHRFDGKRRTSVLTCKERKSEEHVQDRHEVDMYIREDLVPADVSAFLKMAGFESFFTIEKRSYIYHLRHPYSGHACLALYDVWGDGKTYPDARFLEVEIEKDNAQFDAKGAMNALSWWVQELQAVFPTLTQPMNQSLFELYAPKCTRLDLFVSDKLARDGEPAVRGPLCILHALHEGVCKVR